MTLHRLPLKSETFKNRKCQSFDVLSGWTVTVMSRHHIMTLHYGVIFVYGNGHSSIKKNNQHFWYDIPNQLQKTPISGQNQHYFLRKPSLSVSYFSILFCTQTVNRSSPRRRRFNTSCLLHYSAFYCYLPIIHLALPITNVALSIL